MKRSRRFFRSGGRRFRGFRPVPILRRFRFFGNGLKRGQFVRLQIALMGDLRNAGGDQTAARFGRPLRQRHQIDFQGLFAAFRGQFQHINRVGPGSEKFQPGALRTEIVFAVRDVFVDGGALAVPFAALLFAVNHAEFLRRVVTPEIKKFADENLVRDLDDPVFARPLHAQKFVEFVAQNRIVGLDGGADVTVFAIPADFDVVERHPGAVDLFKLFDLGAARKFARVFFQKFLEAGDRVFHQMREFFVDVGDLRLDLAQFALVLLNVEPGDAPHRERQKFVHILVGHVAPEHGAERRQPGMDAAVLFLLASALLDLLVDAVLEEDLRQRLGMKKLVLAVQGQFQLFAEILQKFFGIAVNDLMHGHHRRAPLLDDREIGRDGDCAIGIHIERVQRLFRVVAAGRHHFDVDLFGGVVVDRSDFDLVAFGGLFDRSDQTFGGGGVRDLPDDELAALDLDARPQSEFADPVGILPHIHKPPLREIGIEFKLLFAEHRDLRAQKFAEVVRRNFGGHADRDPLGAQHQQRGDFDRQHHRLLMAPVVGVHQRRDLVVEQHLARQRQKPALDVTRGGGGTAGQDVAEVALFFDEILFVGQHHQRVLDRSVAVRVVFPHDFPDHKSRLVGAVVVDLVHRPENAPLHGFESVIDVGNGAILDDVAGVLHEIGIDHPPEVVVGGSRAGRLDLPFGKTFGFDHAAVAGIGARVEMLFVFRRGFVRRNRSGVITHSP